MTREQKQISKINHQKAWDYFVSIGEIPVNATSHQYHLHHIDPSWQYEDIERYIQWNIEDLKVVTASEHVLIHWTLAKEDGKKYEEWCQNLSKAGRGRPKSEEHKRKIGEGNRGHSECHEGEKNGMFGKGYKIAGEKNGMFGKPSANRGRHWSLVDGRRVYTN